MRVRLHYKATIAPGTSETILPSTAMKIDPPHAEPIDLDSIASITGDEASVSPVEDLVVFGLKPGKSTNLLLSKIDARQFGELVVLREPMAECAPSELAFQVANIGKEKREFSAQIHGEAKAR